MNNRSIQNFNGRRIFQWRPLLLSCLAIHLTGCSWEDSTSKGRPGHYTHVQQEAIRKLHDTQHISTRIHWDIPWVDKQAKNLKPKTQLPKNLQVSLTFSTLENMTLGDFCNFFFKTTATTIRLTPDAEAKLKGLYVIDTGSNSNQNNLSTKENSKKEKNLLPLESKLKKKIYGGTTQEILNDLCSELGLSWRLENNEIQFYYLDTRTFQIQTIGTESSLSVEINSNASAESDGSSQTALGGSSTQSSSLSSHSNALEDIKANIELLLTPGIGRYALSSSTGSLTVSDTETALEKIQVYVEKQNHQLTRQILINLKVLSINLKNSNQMEIDWSAVGEYMKHECQMGSIKVPDDPLFQFKSNTSKDAAAVGSVGAVNLKSLKIFFSALSEQGEVSILTSPSVTTLNLQHVPIQIAEEENYIAKDTTSTTTGSDGSKEITHTIEPSKVTTGLIMGLLPFAMENNDILLQYSINLSELLSIESLGDQRKNGASSEGSESDEGSSKNSDVAGDLIQMPKISNRIFSQKVKIKSGKTLVISGFEQIAQNKTKNTPSIPILNWILGKRSNVQQHNSILILITPTILD